MERKEFLKSALGLCGLAVLPAAVIQSCSKQSYTGPTNVNFTLDLTTSGNAALNTVGGYVISSGVLVIRYSSTVYYAVSATCTHAGCQVAYDGTSRVACPCHGGTFSPSTGAVMGGPPPSALTTYKVTQSGSILTVKS